MLWENPARPFAILTKAIWQRLVVTWRLPTSGGRFARDSVATRPGLHGSSFIYSSWPVLEIERQCSYPGGSHSCHGRKLLVSLRKRGQGQMLIATEKGGDFKGEKRN